MPPAVVDPLLQAPPSTVAQEAAHFDIHDADVDLRAYRAEDWLAFVLFALLGATVFYQFFTRYALNDSASWTEEIARYFLVAIVFIGAAIGVRKNNHIQVDYLYRVLPAKPMRLVATVVDVVRIAFLGTCAVLTWQLIGRIGASRMAVVDLPMGLVYGAVLLGFAAMTWRAIGVARANWRRGASVLERPELADGGSELSPAPDRSKPGEGSS
ncbi:TRAP transporter small permease [Rhizobacter sp. SG703]|uniref:TRAP transporter small permease n=1 Tax=Rhizobacter sp. SG703 TaxID=2587140 RepID=UPI0014473765|nr:TRAP transporter small permease [Rhizobacter sp. SG703]NKI96810.1 TRAP-type C4-dicarboxylate transport system permease small subunit [Rhizobacter sp. SG703]